MTKCLECGSDTEGLAKNLDGIPFRCKSCGAVDFPYQATLDRVFVFPDPPPEKMGDLILPEVIREHYRNEYGVVLSVGPGYVHKVTRKFVPTTIKVGDRVVYDKGILNQMDVPAKDGNSYVVKLMGERDVQGVIEE